ncbi:MAG: cytochrome c3 family protein [Anaerolineae bacterium]
MFRNFTVRRLAILVLLTVGFTSLFVAAVMLVQPVATVYAQDEPEPADYEGADECADCHRDAVRNHEDTAHGLALQDVGRRKQGILADFSTGEDLRTVQFPGEDAPRAFTEDDIALAIGAGRNVQRYAYEVENNEYTVLPAEWDTVNQEWRPYTLSDTWPSPEYDFVNNCAGCHTVGLDVERGRWVDEGVQCEACHGPGSNHVDAARDAGRRPDDEEIAQIHAAIVLSPDAQVCGQCHSQGMTPDSAHPFPVDYQPGGNLLDPEVFQLVSKDDAAAWYATGHGRLNNQQFNEWLSSAHASSLDVIQGNPNLQDGCLNCHSGDVAFYERIMAAYEDETLSGEPPSAPTVDTATNSISCTTCHDPHSDDEEYSLAADSYTLCTSCHRNTDLMQPLHHPVVEMFEGQTIVDGVEGIPSVHFSAEEGPRCVTCHMAEIPVGGATLASHTWRPVIPGEEEDSPPDACSECHDGLTTADLESLVLDTQASIKNRLSVASARLATITQPEEGTDAAANYARVLSALAFVQNDGSLGVHNYAYADALLDESLNLMAQLSVPGSVLEPTVGPHPTATPSAPQPITVGPEVPARTGLRPMTIIIVGAVTVLLMGGAIAVWWRVWRKGRNKETTP